MQEALIAVGEAKGSRSVLAVNLVSTQIKPDVKKSNQSCWKERETYAA